MRCLQRNAAGISFSETISNRVLMKLLVWTKQFGQIVKGLFLVSFMFWMRGHCSIWVACVGMMLILNSDALMNFGCHGRDPKK